MNEFNALFPIPESKRNADDMGLPPPPAKTTTDLACSGCLGFTHFHTCEDPTERPKVNSSNSGLADRIAGILRGKLRLVMTGEETCEQCGDPVDYVYKVKDGCIDECASDISDLVFSAMASGDISVPAEQPVCEARSISDAAEEVLLSRYSALCRQMDLATAPGEFRPGVAESIRKEMALFLPLLKRPEIPAR